MPDSSVNHCCFGHLPTLDFRISPWSILTSNPTGHATTSTTGPGPWRIEPLWKCKDYKMFSGGRGKVASSAERHLLSSLYTEKKYSSSLLGTVLGPFQILMEKWGRNSTNRSLRIYSSNSSTGWDHIDLWKPDVWLCQLKNRFLCPGQTGVY